MNTQPQNPPLWLGLVAGLLVGSHTQLWMDATSYYDADTSFKFAQVGFVWTLGLGLVFGSAWNNKPKLLGLLGLTAAVGWLSTLQSPLLLPLALSALLLWESWDGQKKLSGEVLLSALNSSSVVFVLAAMLGLLTAGLWLLLMLLMPSGVPNDGYPVVVLLTASAFFATALRQQRWGQAAVSGLSQVISFLLPFSTLLLLMLLLSLTMNWNGQVSKSLLGSWTYLAMVLTWLVFFWQGFWQEKSVFSEKIRGFLQHGVWLTLPLLLMGLWGLFVRLQNYGPTEIRLWGVAAALLLLLGSASAILPLLRRERGVDHRMLKILFAATLVTSFGFTVATPALHNWVNRAQLARFSNPATSAAESRDIVNFLYNRDKELLRAISQDDLPPERARLVRDYLAEGYSDYIDPQNSELQILPMENAGSAISAEEIGFLREQLKLRNSEHPEDKFYWLFNRQDGQPTVWAYRSEGEEGVLLLLVDNNELHPNVSGLWFLRQNGQLQESGFFGDSAPEDKQESLPHGLQRRQLLTLQLGNASSEVLLLHSFR